MTAISKNKECQVVTSLTPAREAAITNAEKTENTRNIIALVFIISYLE